MSISIEEIGRQLASSLGVDVKINPDDSLTIAGELTLHRKALDDHPVDGLISVLQPWFLGWELTCTTAGMSLEEAKAWTKRHFAVIVSKNRRN